jgi:hypothetical protein
MNITQSGLAKDGRGRKVHVVLTNLPGDYPVLGIQLTNKGGKISKGGIRKYTRMGKYYSNGGRTADALDLSSFEPGASEFSSDEPARDVVLSYSLDGQELARKTVKEDSDEYDRLTSDGWEEV